MEERITLSENGFKTTTIDNIIYTATNGNVTVDSSTKVVTITGDVNVSENVFQAVTGYTFKINNAATINGIDFSATSYPAQIKYGANHWIVTLDKNCTVGNGSQSLGGLDITTTQPITFNLHAVSGGEDTANVGGIRYASKSDGNVSVTSDGKVSLSGSVSLSKDLSGKTFTTSGDGTISFSVEDNKSVTIDGTKYEVTDAAVISVADKKVTCADGTFSIKPTQNNSVTINGITYTAQASDTSIKLDDGNVTLTGKFNVSLDADKSVKINRFNLSADENVSFTFDSSNKNFVSSSGTLEIATSYGKSFKINGVAVTDNGESGTISLTSGSTALGGNYTVGDGSTSLSNKTFTVDRNEIFFNAKSGDSNLTINDATFSATGKLELTTYFADNDVIKVDGSGVSISGTGNFILVSTDTATINGIDFKSDTAYSNIKANSDSEVTLNNVFTVGDGTQNLGGLTINSQSVIKGSTFNLGTNDSITISGIEYSGSGEIKVDEDNENAVKLSGNVVINLDKDETITINGTAYKATNTASITYNNDTISLGGDIAIDSKSGETTYTFNENSNSITVGNVKFSASDKTSTVTVDTPAENSSDKTKISISGTVTVELNEDQNITDYQFSLTQDSTAQIDGIDFKKTSNTSTDADIVFTSESEVTLNSSFTIGDGSQFLDGLKVSLADGVSATFNLSTLSRSSDGEQTLNGNDYVEVDGVTYSGSGTINTSTSGKTATLNGTINVTGSVTGYNFTLTSGNENSYTFGKTTIKPTSEVSISGISGTLSSDTVLDSDVTIGGLALGISDSAYTLNLNSSGNVESVEGSGTFMIGGKKFITNGTVTFTLENNSVEKITTTESNVTVSVNDADAVPLSSGKELTSYPNGSWGTTPPYDSYIIRDGKVYGVFSGSPATETEITDSTTYSDYFTINNSTANITGDKSVEIEGAYTAIAGGKTYEITSGGSGTFDNSGITSLDGGTIYRTIDSGNFTYNNGTYTIDDSPVKFTVTSPPLNDDTSLTSGGGYSTVTTGTTFTLDGDTIYTAQSGSKYIAKGNESGGYTAFSGTATYTLNGGNFTAETNKEYTIDGAATYQLTSEGLESGDISTELKTATGTRAFASGDSATKSYLGDTYNVTGGTYQLSITNGTEGTKSLTAGSATRTVTSGQNFNYIYGNATREYAATSSTTIEISFTNNDITVDSKSGGGTRTVSGTETTTYKNDTYTLDSNAKILLTLSDGKENFESGTAKYTARSGNKFHTDDSKEYTATTETATLTLTKNSDGTSTSLTGGSGTRADSESSFTYSDKSYTSNGNVTYILKSSGENVFKASGSRTDVSGDTYTVGNHTYNLTTGTYQINVDNSTGNDTLISGEGSGTINEGNTFTHNSKTYTAFDGDVTLNLSVSNSGNTKNETFNSGKGTRSDSANTFTHNAKTYNKTSSNITYLAENGGTESVYSASGTRAFTSNDNETYTFNEDEYTATGGTYSINVTTGTGTETLSSGSATYHLNSGTFHYNNKEYNAVSETTLTISLENDAAKELTNATGTGTRQAVAADSTITFNYDNDTYNTSEGSTIKAVINGTSGATESLWNGTATYTAQEANSGTFHYNNKEYNAVSDTTITLEVGNGSGTSKTFGTGSAGTRTDTEDTFTATGVKGTYNRTSDNITYMLTGSGQTLNETVYNATGTRTNVTDENHVGDWGNTYTSSEGTRTLTVTDGESSDVLTSASATNNYTNGNTFKYGESKTEYTAQIYGATLNLSITNDTPTESFSSGSGQNDTGYIVKGGYKVDIDNVTYAAAADSVVTVTGTTAITGISGGTITGTFNNNSATIGGITYEGSGSLKVNGVNDVTAENGNFTATGDFSTARTINSSRTLNITGDTDVKATFSTGDVTKIENLNNGATIVNAGGATTAIAAENGTYTFENQTFVIANDNVAGLTFTLAAGKVTKISGLDRGTNYVTVQVGDETAYIRRTGDEVTVNEDGTLSTPDLGISLYVVEYSADGKWTVNAVDSQNKFVTLLKDNGYTVSNKILTITDQASVPIVLENKSTTPITVGGVSGIESTGSSAIEIENGKFKIGTYNSDTKTFTEGVNGKSVGNFDVDSNGKFTVDDSGKITVEAKGANTVAITVDDMSSAGIAVKGNGTFKINNEVPFQITSTNSDITVGVSIDSTTGEMSFDPSGACTIEVSLGGYAPDLAEDTQILAQSADGTSFLAYTIKGTRIAISGDDDGSVKYVTDDNGNLSGVKNVSEDAMIILTGTMPSSFSVNEDAIAGTIGSGTKIKKNSFTGNWTSGLAAAAASENNYNVEINSIGEIILKVGDNQTKNVNDYKAAVGASYVPKNGTNEEDDGTLPKYSNSISLTNRVDKLTISPPGSKEYTINDKTITFSGDTEITAVSEKNFNNSIAIKLTKGKFAIYDGMTFSGNDSDTNITIPSDTSGTVTIDDKTKVTGVTLGSSFSAKGDIVLDGITVKDIGDTYKTISGITTSGDTTGFTVDSKALSVKNDSQYTVSAGDSKYISGVKGGAELSGTFITAQNVSIVTESVGNIKIGSNSYVISGDGSVTLNSSSGTVTKIDDLGASASVTGNFTNEVEINSDTKKVKVTGDDDIGVALNENSAISKIYNLSGGAVVDNAGGATLLSTDGVGGEFKFGSKTYSLSAGTADFISSGDTPTVSGIKNISANSTLTVGANSSNFTIGGNTITNSTAATLHMGNNTIAGVENFTGEISGLSEGATVNVKTTNSVTINTADVQISDSDYYVYVKGSTGYSTITSVAAGSTITKAAKDAIIIPDTAGTFTFNGHTFTTDSKPTFTMGDSDTVSAIGGVSGNIALYQDETGLKVLNDTITITGAGAGSTEAVTLVAGNGSINQVKNLKGNVNGLNAGAVANVKIGTNVQINGKNLTTGDSDYTVRAKEGGYDLITGLSNGANVSAVEGNVSLVTDEVGTYILGGDKFGVSGDDTVTFITDANSKVTDINDVRSATISVYGGESGLKINGTAITLQGSDANPVKVKINGDGGIEGFEGLKASSEYNLPSGATLEIATDDKITINNQELQISNASTNKVTVRATENGYDKVDGIKSGAVVTAAKDVTLYSAANGTYTFNSKAFTTGGDATVGFVMGASNNLAHILDLTGTISGNFTSSVTVNNKTVNVTGDTDISIVGSGGTEGISKIAGLSNNAIVNNAGGATTISTDNAGEFTFKTGTDTHKFSLSGTAGFLAVQAADYNPSITGIKDIGDNVTVEVYQDENSLVVENNTIKLTGATSNSPVKLAMNGDTISTVSNLTGEISGLSEGASVLTADGEVTVNNARLNITGDNTAATVLARDYNNGYGYGTIKGFAAEVTFAEAKNASLVTKAEGDYTFGSGTTHKFNIAGDTDVTLSTDANSKVTAIDGINVADALLAVYQNEDININGREIHIGGLSDNAGSSAVSLKFDASRNITEVSNLTGYINNLPENVPVQVADNDVTINGVALKINESGGTNFNVKSKATGYDTITGISKDATISQAANVSIVANISDMADNKHKFLFGSNNASMEIVGDSDVTIATDNNSDATAIGGFNGTLQSTADNLKINGVNIYNTDDNVTVVADSGVEHGISSIIGLSANKEISVHSGVAVSIKPNAATEETKFTINGTAYDLTGDNNGIVIKDRTITNLDADARLTISAVGSFNVNTKPLELTTDRQIVIGEGTEAARLYNPSDIDFGANTPVEDVVKQVLGTEVEIEDATISANYTDNIWTVTDTSKSIVVTENDNGKTINITGNSDILIVHTTANNININTSSDTGKANTVVSSGENIIVTGNNNTHVMPTSGKSITYNGYDHSNNAGIQITNEDVISAVHNNLLKFNGEAITLPNNATVTLDYNGTKGIVNFYNIQGEMQKVGYTYGDNTKIESLSGDENMILRGHWSIEGGISGAKSTLYGGNGNDTAFGGAGDYFNLGSGENYVEIYSTDNVRINYGKATVESSGVDGTTTVKGFKPNDFATGDVIKINTGITNAEYTNGILTLTQTGNSSKLIIQDMTAKEEAPKEDDTDTTIAYVNVLLDNNQDTSDDTNHVKTSIAKAGAIINVANTTSDDDFAKAYVGNGSGVDFSEYDTSHLSSVNINLGDGSGTLGTDTIIAFRGITSLKGGNSTHTLIGSASDENTLEAGNGAATIWGKGSSNDLLIGNTDKSSSTTFYFTTGDGSDTISNFQFYDATKDDDTNAKADKISLGADVSSVTHSGNDLVIVVSGGDSLTLKDGVGKKFTIAGSDGSVKSAVTGSILPYEGANAYYSATDENATLAISSSVTEAITTIDLSDGSKYSENITVIDASSIPADDTHKVSLVGGKGVDNTIKAAQNGSSLYGGTGSSGNDIMVGGSSGDIFIFNTYNGDDTIQGYGANDTVYFKAVTSFTAQSFSTVEATVKIGDNDVVLNGPKGYKINTNSSGSLTIIKADSYTDDITFKLVDGKTYTGFENLKKGQADESADLAYDYWEVAENNELLDGEVTFWNGYDVSTNDENNYLTDEICTGNINFSIAPADTIYSFSDK